MACDPDTAMGLLGLDMRMMVGWAADLMGDWDLIWTGDWGNTGAGVGWVMAAGEGAARASL